MTAYFGIEKNDEMNDKSEEFFKVFQAFFKQIEQALPKEQKKKAAPAKTGLKAGGPGGAGNALMAELMAKQAEQAAKAAEKEAQ